MAEHVAKPERAARTKPKADLKPPPMFRVILHNDHYTSMDFVVHVLIKVFKKAQDEAVRVMLQVHQKGVGICGTYPHEIAETKVATVHKLAEKNGYPLKCSMEPD